MVMNIEEFMAKLAEDDDQRGDDNMTNDELVAAYGRYISAREVEWVFHSGQIVRFKTPDLSHYKDTHLPHVFMDYLPEAKPVYEMVDMKDASDMFSPMAAIVLDCRVAVVKRGVFTVYLMNSSDFEPHPDYQNTSEKFV